MKYPLSNKRVLVTGATSGIGEQLCIDLSLANNQVIACGRDETKLHELKTGHTGITHCLAFDSTNKSAIEQAFKQAELDYLDCIILNAGTCEYVDCDAIDSALFERVMATNFMGTIHCLEHCLPLLKKSDAAHLSIMGSSSIFFPFSRAEAYGASKAALAYLAKSLRVDLASFGIGVSIINPGFVSTPLTHKNDFPMPTIIDTESASKKIIKGIERGQLEIHFPKRLTLTLKILGLLPSQLQFSIGKKLIKT